MKKLIVSVYAAACLLTAGAAAAAPAASGWTAALNTIVDDLNGLIR